MERRTMPSLIRLKPIPLRKDVERYHQIGKPSLEIVPDPVAHMLGMTHYRQHGQHSLHFHTLIPLASTTELEIVRVALCAVETGISQHDHTTIEALNQALEAAVMHICGVAIPSHHQSKVVQYQAKLAADYPPVVGLSLLAYLSPVVCLLEQDVSTRCRMCPPRPVCLQKPRIALSSLDAREVGGTGVCSLPLE